MISISKYYSLALLFALLFLGTGCRTYDNFTTYFNTYYNAQRLIKESEDEFEFSAIAVKKPPRTLVPLDSGVLFGGNQPTRNETAPFIRDYIIDKARIQPVQTKLDSVLIKGSKILQNHPKSNFIEGSLYLMAKSYYYKNDWLNAEIKCSELVDLFPFGDLSPDAHLLMAQAYFIERKYLLGEQALSRCIDIAWYKDRYDILAEAFKFSAEHYIYFNDVEKAVRPYKQAIAITESGAQASKWHLELGSIYYRLSRWEEAEKEFHQVGDFDVDLLGEYEARLFRASSLIYMKKYTQAEEILVAMSSNENYKDWEGSLLAEKMRLYRLSGKDSLFIDSEKKADTYSGNPNIASMYFEKGMEYFKKNDYVKSRIYFAKSRGAKSPVARAANEYYSLLNEMETNQIEIHKTNQLVKKNLPITDTVRTLTAARYFAVGRVFEKIGKNDSALRYFYKAADSCPHSSQEKAQFLYSIHRKIKDSLPAVADSLMEIMAITYGKTEYGKEARAKLGFTELAEIDTAGDYYNSGSRFRLTGNDSLAIRQYKTVFTMFPKSKYAARSLYAVGWTFERKLFLLDSAIFYYKKLVSEYPMSDYALEVAPSLSAWDLKRIPLQPDSLIQKGFHTSTLPGQQQPVDTAQKQSNTIQVVTDPNMQSMPVDFPPGQKESSFPLKLPTSLKDVLKMEIPTELPKLDSFNPFKSKSDTTRNSRQDTVPTKKKP